MQSSAKSPCILTGRRSPRAWRNRWLGTTTRLISRCRENAIAGSVDTELRIYPNLMGHVLDAPHGIDSGYLSCPEAIASKGNVNLLVLQLLKKAGQDNCDPGNPRASLSAAARMSAEDTRNQLSGL